MGYFFNIFTISLEKGYSTLFTDFVEWLGVGVSGSWWEKYALQSNLSQYMYEGLVFVDCCKYQKTRFHLWSVTKRF